MKYSTLQQANQITQRIHLIEKEITEAEANIANLTFNALIWKKESGPIIENPDEPMNADKFDKIKAFIRSDRDYTFSVKATYGEAREFYQKILTRLVEDLKAAKTEFENL